MLPSLGCWAPTHEGMSHFDAAVWGNAFATQLERPDQLAIEAAALAATIVLAGEDYRLQKESTEEQPITEGSTTNGDAVAVGLGVLAAGSSAAKWIGGDQGRDAEVLLESIILTDGITEILKHTVRRPRPANDSNDSFPSGHTSFAFSMATFLQRSWTDDHGGWVGYLAYAPALYVGIDRIESNKHWPTDVAFGAFLGVLLTNVVYDAHYGEAGRPGLFGVRGLGLEPAVGTESAEVALVLRF